MHRRHAEQEAPPATRGSVAIPVDRLREVFPQMMSPQERFGLVLGIDVDTMSEEPTVARLAPGSPAAAAGVRVGDRIVHAGGCLFWLSRRDRWGCQQR